MSNARCPECLCTGCHAASCPTGLRIAMGPPSINTLRAIVTEQADDGALWFVPETAPEAYLQAALRRLHAAVESVRP